MAFFEHGPSFSEGDCRSIFLCLGIIFGGFLLLWVSASVFVDDAKEVSQKGDCDRSLSEEPEDVAFLGPGLISLGVGSVSLIDGVVLVHPEEVGALPADHERPGNKMQNQRAGQVSSGSCAVLSEPSQE